MRIAQVIVWKFYREQVVHPTSATALACTKMNISNAANTSDADYDLLSAAWKKGTMPGPDFSDVWEQLVFKCNCIKFNLMTNSFTIFHLPKNSGVFFLMEDLLNLLSN